jgi:hypothetical protein
MVRSVWRVEPCDSEMENAPLLLLQRGKYQNWPLPPRSISCCGQICGVPIVSPPKMLDSARDPLVFSNQPSNPNALSDPPKSPVAATPNARNFCQILNIYGFCISRAAKTAGVLRAFAVAFTMWQANVSRLASLCFSRRRAVAGPETLAARASSAIPRAGYRRFAQQPALTLQSAKHLSSVRDRALLSRERAL